eukprot:TRINITY_DN72369_c0_g1_i1.p1 TRINITY_DN72369_c0_g1~~TRINITY_DN72369_c0_g1_i1.p1  ORF type:complete len:273 (+),score=12.79 TRINITY_DN72369_c0_g1_i1:48-866(+)
MRSFLTYRPKKSPRSRHRDTVSMNADGSFVPNPHVGLNEPSSGCGSGSEASSYSDAHKDALVVAADDLKRVLACAERHGRDPLPEPKDAHQSIMKRSPTDSRSNTHQRKRHQSADSFSSSPRSSIYQQQPRASHTGFGIISGRYSAPPPLNDVTLSDSENCSLEDSSDFEQVVPSPQSHGPSTSKTNVLVIEKKDACVSDAPVEAHTGIHRRSQVAVSILDDVTGSTLTRPFHGLPPAFGKTKGSTIFNPYFPRQCSHQQATAQAKVRVAVH